MDRGKRINQVEAALREAYGEDRIVNIKEFNIYICEMFNCSHRTAKEYIDISLSRIGKVK